ncbi:hypothetical protein JTE90_027801 [Oedothorax gibbosus]|uniref:Uncharacterized protein n=1 Tax=Oedothorax gibbosus TaxID=931172 RepID=A0AAV6V882_9ARAC|nr:hypothetical protein JTE90_027801 [Oedothorax gibbosus]
MELALNDKVSTVKLALELYEKVYSMTRIVVFLLLVCLVSLSIAEGDIEERKKRQNEDGYERNYQCFNKQLCNCGSDGYESFQQCYDQLHPRSQKWFYRALNKCQGLQEPIASGNPFTDWAPKICSLDEKVKKACSKHMTNEISLELDRAINKGKYGKDVKEKAEIAFACLQRIFGVCHDTPDQCSKKA